MLSISWNIRVSVCSLLRYRLNVFLPPLHKVGCPKFLKIRSPWGKVMKRKGLRFEHFSSKMVSNRPCKKVSRRFFSFIICSLHLNVFLPPLSELQCPNFLDFPLIRKLALLRGGQRSCTGSVYVRTMSPGQVKLLTV